MKVEAVELWRLRLPLVTPFRTSQHSDDERVALLVCAHTTEGAGWADCAVSAGPFYEPEFLSGARAVMAEYLVPMLTAAPAVTAARVQAVLAPVKGHQMAKAALETAVLDAELRGKNMSFATYLGAVRDRVPAGVSVGIPSSLAELISQVEGYLEQGYRRVKLKIEPGWDIEPVGAVRERFGPDLALQADANTAYTLASAARLRDLDEFGLLLLEQPLAADDLLGHAELARPISTPVCLDESITSPRAAAAALRLGACSVINIKPARVGGYLAARARSTTCARLTASRCGAAGCWKPGWAARPTWPWPPWTTSPLPATSPRPQGTTRRTSPHRSSSKTGTSPSRPGRAPESTCCPTFSTG